MMNNDFTKRLVGILGTVVGFILLLTFLRFGLAVYLYSAVGKWATTQLGLDYYESEFMAVAVSTLMMCFVPGVGWLLVSRKRRFLNAAVVIGGYLVVCGLVYTVGRNTFFDQNTGNSLRYYADTPDGRVFSFLPGYDPKWGIERKPYTREAAQEAIRQIELEKERKKKAELELQRQEEERRKRDFVLALKQQQAERKQLEREQARQEAQAQRAYELEKQKLLAEERRGQRQHELQLAEQQQEAEQQNLEDEEQQERAAAERERERQAAHAERQRQAQMERQRQQSATGARQEQEQRQQSEEAKRKRAEVGALIVKGVRVAEKISGKTIRLPF
jgi:hypothetical protein